MSLRRYKKKFQAYINRDIINYISEEIDPLDYHSMFVTSATLFNIIDNKKMSTLSYIIPICSLISAVTAGTLFLIAVVHYVRAFKIHLATECGTYLLIMIYKLFMIRCMTKGKKYYHKLMQALRADFHYIYTNGQKYRGKFFENQKGTFQACVFVAASLGCVGSGMAICALIALAMVIYSKEGDEKRPLPYPFWLFDYDLQASPIYEILFFSSILFTVLYTNQYIFMVQSQVIWVREIMTRADVIIWNLHDLLIDVLPAQTIKENEHNKVRIKYRMREIIEMHHSMYELMADYAAVFKKCLLFEQFFGGPIICLTAYSFAEKYDQGDFKLILLMLCLTQIGVAFIPCYLGTHLLEKVQSVGDACWEIPFWNSGPFIRPYLVLIMQRSMRQLPIVSSGFSDISLQTYSRMISRAYSCFNMLRQADLNFT